MYVYVSQNSFWHCFQLPCSYFPRNRNTLKGFPYFCVPDTYKNLYTVTVWYDVEGNGKEKS